MKTMLPIPEQDGYRLTLPERVTLSAGTTIQSLPDGLALTRNPTTRLFIEKLRAIAEVSPVAYAAAMIFIERPPTGTELSSDPLYQSLMSYYGFSERLVRPLWWHATENLQAGHSTLGAVVISGRRALHSHSRRPSQR